MVLGRVAWGDAAVSLPAGVGRGAALGRFGVPFEDPVAVAVGADAGCVEGWARLAVFAPEAVVGLGVDEAYREEQGVLVRVLSCGRDVGARFDCLPSGLWKGTK